MDHIAIFENVPKEDEYKIRDEFDKINIIYSIDLVFVDEKIKKELLNSILKDGVDLNWKDLKKEKKNFIMQHKD